MAPPPESPHAPALAPDHQLVHTCPNCGYSLRGLADRSTPCPECGSRNPLHGASPEWVSTMRSGLSLLSWSIPALLLAWASPGILQVARGNGMSALVTNSSWLLLIAAVPSALGLRRVERCLPPPARPALRARLIVLGIVALGLDALGISDFITRCVCTITQDFNSQYDVWPPICLAVFGAALWASCSVIWDAVRECGLIRAAIRLRRVVLIVAIAVPVLGLWQQEGYRFVGLHRSPSYDTGDPSPLQIVLNFTTELAAFLGPLLITAVALLAWLAVLSAREEITAHDAA